MTAPITHINKTSQRQRKQRKMVMDRQVWKVSKWFEIHHLTLRKADDMYYNKKRKKKKNGHTRCQELQHISVWCMHLFLFFQIQKNSHLVQTTFSGEEYQIQQWIQSHIYSKSAWTSPKNLSKTWGVRGPFTRIISLSTSAKWQSQTPNLQLTKIVWIT